MASHLELDDIVSRLRSNDPTVQSYGAFCLRNNPELTELAIDDLINAMNKASSNERVLIRGNRSSEEFVILHGALALSDFLQHEQSNDNVVATVKSQLLKLAGSQNEVVAAYGIVLLGNLGAKGAFAWTTLVEICNQPKCDAVVELPTIRALAYRTMLKIDAKSALLMGESTAKLELAQTLRKWIEKQTGEIAKGLQHELANLQL